MPCRVAASWPAGRFPENLAMDAAGSTACAFGRAAGDAGALYVTTNGGMTAPWRGVVQEAKLLRLEMR